MLDHNTKTYESIKLTNKSKYDKNIEYYTIVMVMHKSPLFMV